MVNVPPIPPLLCSTPPPIDFGEEDEDVDVMPPTLNGMDDEDYDEYLTVDDDSKSDEPLPSPRLPSATDIPADIFYDDHMPPDEDVSNYVTPPPIDDKLSKTKSKTNSINITEAYNFNITNRHQEANNKTNDNSIDTTQVETILTVKSNEEQEKEADNSCIYETESTSFKDNKDEISKTVSKNLKDLRIETSSLVESKNNNDKPNMNCMQNVVSIEDIEDDLSDDELYSPKTPKNFKETDNINDYFKIHEINSETIIENSKDVLKKTDTKANDSETSASVENDNEFKSLSSNSFPQQSFDLPPPLEDPLNSFDVEDDDDFGDFADFQDFNTTITPPTNQIYVDSVPGKDKKQLNDEEFKDFLNHNSQANSTDITKMEAKEKLTHDSESFIDTEEFKDKFITHKEEFQIDDSQPANYNSKEIAMENGSTTAAANNGSEEFTVIKEDISSGDLKKDADKNEESTQLEYCNDFGEFTQSTEKQQEQTIESSDCKENDDDNEFNDFADFEQHKTIPKQYIEFKEAEKPTAFSKDDTDDDDDDFGDFNTAQPVNPTVTQKSSHNISTTTAPMLTPKIINERISKILQLMFTPAISNNEVSTAEPKAHKIQDIPFTSIDAAKALEYQWLNSDTRHSFIRSLGIDSRNILFGENWNPSLPRFAANLSFNPLKPMRPVTLSDSALEPVAVNTTESKKPLSMEFSNSLKKENIDLDWKSSNMNEQTKEALKDNSLTLEISTATNSLSYVPNEPPQEPESLTIFENPLDNEDTFSKTPPISEMESVTTFSSSLPTTTALDMELTSSHIIDNLNNLAGKEVEEDLKNTLNLNEVVATSTFTGSFKETHIYTPSKTNEFETKHTAASSSSPSKSSAVDFDFEKAAMGVVIDETVVKKEYRDVEYNPTFSMTSSLNNKSATNKIELLESNKTGANSNTNNVKENDIKMSVDTPLDEEDSNDDFTEFQSVPSDAYTKSIPQSFNSATEISKPIAAVSHGGMILSPAILIPQAIFMENNKSKPKIEWGDSTANINAEEMARIDELFPEPKSLKSSNTSSSSQKSTPTHQMASTPSISATVHNKELGGGGGCGANNDDDDWSEFVSVSITNNTSSNRTVANNNILINKSPAGSPFKQRSPVVPHRMPITAAHTNNSNNDDEWSDFVSSAPQPPVQTPSYRAPQFNSGAWQNANFYNNPLSMYHKGPINLTSATTQHSPKHFYNNNINNNNNVHQQYQQTANKMPPGIGGYQQQQQQHNHHHHQMTPQQIHIMQNFSTAPVPTPERLTIANTAKNNQFQVGSAKVAPSIALIPDLGFVAPAIPTHTSFINSLPKPSINTKK